MDKKYDLIIVGMGPGGIFCAYELIQKNLHKNILLIEQGKSISNRFCPLEKHNKCLECKPYCSITSGFSGAGAFSDGKLLSYHLSLFNKKSDDIYLGGNDGSFIKQYYSTDEIRDLIAYTDDVYLSFGADKKLYGIDHRPEIEIMQKKASKEGLNLIDIPLRHLGTEKAHILYKEIENYLIKHNVELLFNTNVYDFIIENGQVKGVRTNSSLNPEQKTDFYSDKVVVAVGRKGAKWFANKCVEHNISTKLGSVDIGIRYELPDKIMEKINTYLYEGKFIGRPTPFNDKVRTFCQNPSGFVSTEVYDNNLMLVNGHSYKDRKTTNTNLAILVSHNFNYPFKKPIQYGINIAENLNQLGNGNIVVQRLGDIYRGKRTWDEELKNNSVKPTLSTAVAGDITYAIGYRTMTNILQFIRSVDKVVEGFANPDNLLYGPEIKFYSNSVIVDKNFETNISGLHCIGDGGGLTTGLMMASASGVQMARIYEKCKTENK